MPLQTYNQYFGAPANSFDNFNKGVNTGHNIVQDYRRNAMDKQRLAEGTRRWEAGNALDQRQDQRQEGVSRRAQEKHQQAQQTELEKGLAYKFSGFPMDDPMAFAEEVREKYPDGKIAQRIFSGGAMGPPDPKAANVAMRGIKALQDRYLEKPEQTPDEKTAQALKLHRGKGEIDIEQEDPADRVIAKKKAQAAYMNAEAALIKARRGNVDNLEPKDVEHLKDQLQILEDIEEGKGWFTGARKLTPKEQTQKDGIERVLGNYYKQFEGESQQAAPSAPTQAPAPAPAALPEGVTEEDMAHTMKEHGLSREEVLSRMGAQ